MSNSSKPVDWEIFNIPPIQPVQYYPILKKKREFSQLIRQYDAQVFKHGYLHYCGIVPKNISSSLNNKYELFIVFFGEVPNTSFIGFRVKVCKETFMHESNSLLLFLKNSKKIVFYLKNNNCIHVQCGTNAWELFYLLYDVYLRQYVLTVIGTQFFYHFVYSYCFQKEIQLLELLFKGSKIIRVSKKSIYYKIHRKRKISVTDLIHMTLNLPKSKRCVISSFTSKELLLNSDCKDGNFYTCFGSKIHVSKLVLKKFKKQFQDTAQDSAISNPIALGKVLAPSYSEFNLHSDELLSKYQACNADVKSKHVSSSNISLKRKFEEIENDECSSQSSLTASKFLKISEPVCLEEVNEGQWEQFRKFKPYTVKSYSDIPCLKYLVPNLLSNDNSSHIINSDSYLFNNHCHVSVQSDILPSISLVKEIDLKSDSLPVKEKHEIASQIKLHSTTKSDYNYKAYVASRESTSLNESQKLTNVLTNRENSASKSISSNLQIPYSTKYESLCHAHEIISSINSVEKPLSTATISTFEDFNEDEINSSKDVNFTTAAGKNIKISNTAIVTAHRLIQDFLDDGKHTKIQEKINCDPIKTFKRSPSFKNNNLYLKKKTVTGDVVLDKMYVKSPYGNRNFKQDSEVAIKKLDAAFSDSINENFGLDNFNTVEDVSFSTAAGKNINVSSAAMQAAHKLIQDVLKEEKEIAPSTANNYGIHKQKICRSTNAFKDVSCPSKKSGAEEIDIAMDKTLVEKFFEDTLFDEKELGTASEFNKDDNKDIVLEPKSDKNLPTRKSRKSLGGRRSMRFCSDTLQ